MKKFYTGNNTAYQMYKLNNMIRETEAVLERFCNYGSHYDGFLEKYSDPYFDTFRDSEADYEISNSELCENFQVAYGYLLHLRWWVGIEQDYINGTL